MGLGVSDTIYDSDTEMYYDVDFNITSYGSPPHMGSLTYPGDPGDPPEIEITFVRPSDLPKDIRNYDASQSLLERLEEKILEGIGRGCYEPDEEPGSWEL